MAKFRVSVAGETVKLLATSVSELGAVVDVASRYGVVTIERMAENDSSEYLTRQEVAEQIGQQLFSSELQ